MTLRGRIVRLEAQRLPVAVSDGRARLAATLDRLAARVQASGDTRHHSGASVAENVARAMLRGDADSARAMLRGALGRLSAAK